MQLVADKLDDEINMVFKDMIEYHHSRTLSINSTGKEVKELMKQMLKEIHQTEQIQPNIHYHAFTWSTLALCIMAMAIIIIWIKRRPMQKIKERVKFVGAKGPEAEPMERVQFVAKKEGEGGGGPTITFWAKKKENPTDGTLQEVAS
jgi:hypothetical protein